MMRTSNPVGYCSVTGFQQSTYRSETNIFSQEWLYHFFGYLRSVSRIWEISLTMTADCFKPIVFSFRKQFKIARIFIGFVAVLMMHDLVRAERPTDLFFHKISMLVNVATVDAHREITKFHFDPATFPCGGFHPGKVSRHEFILS